MQLRFFILAVVDNDLGPESGTAKDSLTPIGRDSQIWQWAVSRIVYRERKTLQPRLIWKTNDISILGNAVKEQLRYLS